MKKFIVLYHAPMDAMAQTASMSPDDQAKGMELWMQWAQRTGDKLVDLGAPLMNGQKLNPGGMVENSTRDVAGYSIIQAENMEQAKALFATHPHIAGWNQNATIEIHETMPLPGM